MKKRTKCLFILLLINSVNSFALDNYPVGARSLGLSHAFVSFSDSWSTFHNQAGLAGVSGVSAGFFYESKFNIDELSLVAGSVVLPVKAGTFGISFFQFGKGTFKEHKFALAFAKKLSTSLSAGVQLDYFSQTFPENARANGFATFESGIIWSPTDKLFIGGHIFNPISAGIETPSGKQKMPFVFRTGGHYQFDEMVLTTIEAEKSSNHPVLLKAGIEFQPVENLALRFGVAGKSINYTAGIGYRTGKLSTDIGFSYHGNLGVTPSISVQFKL
ncbi:MAG: hypothetical protein ACOC1D_02000 [Prolixibacteraceae bacterium]